MFGRFYASGNIPGSVKEEIKTEIAKLLKDKVVQLYDLVQSEEGGDIPDYSLEVQKINQTSGGTGVCAKQLEYGQVAWRCMDCEKDPTAIICNDCFDKSDHTGHRVQLKRNVGGCCDCGDPDAWNPPGFCTDHKGYDQSPELILKKMPTKIRANAEAVFYELGLKLKQLMLSLHQHNKKDAPKSVELVYQISQIFGFFAERVKEVAIFLYIIDDSIKSAFLDEAMKKPMGHKCCMRFFPCSEAEATFKAQLDSMEDSDELCTCSVLDLCLQTNHYLNKEGKDKVYEFLFKLFQSYSFKQALTLSLAANYHSIIDNRKSDTGNDIHHISVQVFTSAEMALLLLQNETLLNNMLDGIQYQFEHLVKQQANSYEQKSTVSKCWAALNDFKYMARTEVMQFTIQHTNFIERMIKIASLMYKCDIKEPRTTMVGYLQEGSINEDLINLEMTIIKVMKTYLKEIKHNDLEKNRSVLNTFIQCFVSIYQDLKTSKKLHHGLYIMPLHRIFGIYFARLMMYNYAETVTKPGGSQLEDVFQRIFLSNLSNDMLQQMYQSEESQIDLEFNHGVNEHLGSSLVEPKIAEQIGLPPFVELVQQVLSTQMMQMSFVHQVAARKWVKLGEYLEYYPTIYFKNWVDIYMYRDFSNLQMLLCLDSKNQLFDFFVFNFGLDSQLKILLNGLRYGSLQKRDFKQCQEIDPVKLKLELCYFLRLVIQICICDIPYLQQLQTKKENPDLKQEAKNELKRMNDLSVKKEVVHQLLLNKTNVNIQTLKEEYSHLFKHKDFEAMLFEVSLTSRDLKNKVTFKLKDEYYGWFDPFSYICFGDHSQIFLMYEQNQLADKFRDQGLNDIIGDYKGNFPQTNKVNALLLKNLAKSDMISVIVPLLINWIENRNQSSLASKSEIINFKKEQLKEKASFTNVLRSMLYDEDMKPSNGSQLIDEIKDSFVRKMSNEVYRAEEGTPSRKSSMPKGEIDGALLNLFVDQNVGYHCLKLLALILNTANSCNEAELYHARLIACLKMEDDRLIHQLLNMHGEETCIPKMKDILEFLLKSIYQLNPKEFVVLETLCGNQVPQEMEDIAEISRDQPRSSLLSVDNPENKKEALKKRQNKLMAKMKKKATTFIEKKAVANIGFENPVVESEKKQDYHNCAFCQEELRPETFVDHPYGNFVYFSNSKLLYYALEQTIKRQQSAFKNETMSKEVTMTKQDEEEVKQGETQINSGGQNMQEQERELETLLHSLSQEASDSEGFQRIIQDRIKGFLDSKLKSQSKQKDEYLELAKIVCNIRKDPDDKNQEEYFDYEDLQNQFINLGTGAGSAITFCKHYAHQSCVQKYKTEHQINHHEIYQKQLAGLSQGEFQCPICKGLSNCLLPSVCLSQVAKNQKLISLEPNSAISLLNFYMDPLSDLIKSMKGQKSGVKPHDTLLTELKMNPYKIISQVVDHLVHFILLVDIKGLDYIQKSIESEIMMYDSLSMLSQIDHPQVVQYETFDSIMYLESYLESQFESNVLTSNLGVILLKTLLIMSLKPSEHVDDQLTLVLDAFLPILKLQCIFSVMWRKSSGQSISIDIFNQEYKTLIKNFELEKSQDEYLNNLYVEAMLPVLRKVCVVVYLIRETTKSQSDVHVLNQMQKQSSNNEELDVILKYLKLKKPEKVEAREAESWVDPYQNNFDETMTEIVVFNNEVANEQPDQLLPLKQLIQPFRQDKFYSEMLNDLQTYISKAQNQMSMPTNLILLTPFFEFNFLDIPKSYLNLQTDWYRKPCSYCKKERSDTVTCLLCGQIMCWTKLRDGGQCRAPGCKSDEGLISFHTRTVEGGCSLYLHTSSSNFIFVYNGNNYFFDTPYRNRYGELADQYVKHLESYVIDNEGGGESAIHQMKQKYMDFAVANTIVQHRLNHDQKYKRFLKNQI